ncbi:MAG: hypothetical protein JNK72_25060 [Myxococcales bacterium]|nr:hypothetical protein [Myxococcales bacterium]
MLHHFLRGDEDRELHNHPWFGVSLVLAGGYDEERRVWTPEGQTVRLFHRRPGRFNVIWPHTFHRVVLPEGQSAWTIFITGPVAQSWGFWSRLGDTFTPHREFFRQKAERRKP